MNAPTITKEDLAVGTIVVLDEAAVDRINDARIEMAATILSPSETRAVVHPSRLVQYGEGVVVRDLYDRKGYRRDGFVAVKQVGNNLVSSVALSEIDHVVSAK